MVGLRSDPALYIKRGGERLIERSGVYVDDIICVRIGTSRTISTKTNKLCEIVDVSNHSFPIHQIQDISIPYLIYRPTATQLSDKQKPSERRCDTKEPRFEKMKTSLAIS